MPRNGRPSTIPEQIRGRSFEGPFKEWTWRSPRGPLGGQGRAPRNHTGTAAGPRLIGSTRIEGFPGSQIHPGCGKTRSWVKPKCCDYPRPASSGIPQTPGILGSCGCTRVPMKPRPLVDPGPNSTYPDAGHTHIAGIHESRVPSVPGYRETQIDLGFGSTWVPVVPGRRTTPVPNVPGVPRSWGPGVSGPQKPKQSQNGVGIGLRS